MHNDVAVNLMYYVFSTPWLILFWVEWNKKKNKLVFDQSGEKYTFVGFV